MAGSAGHAAVRTSRGAQKITNLRLVDKLRRGVLSTIPLLGSCQNPVEEAGPTTSGALSQTGEGLYSGIVHRVAEDDGSTGSYSFCSMHEGCTTGSALSSLPAPLRQFLEGRRTLHAYVEATDFGSCQKGNQSGTGDSDSFSGISMRRGGISQAVHAKMLEPILYLQSGVSGHGSGLAART